MLATKVVSSQHHEVLVEPWHLTLRHATDNIVNNEIQLVVILAIGCNKSSG